eukprot:5096561-Ditylum_brightwellii.AAC.1
MNAKYTLVQGLLRDDTLTTFNNKQAMCEEHMLENLEHCLNTVTVYVFPNKAYKLQKQYIWYMMHKPRHVSAYEWITRIIKLNNYITELSTPAEVEARKMDQEEILDALEN